MFTLFVAENPGQVKSEERAQGTREPYSHSIVAGGLELMS